MGCLTDRGWRREELAALRRHACLLEVAADTEVTAAADRVRPFVIVVDGRLAVTGRDGVRLLEPGDCWGAESLLGGPPSTERVRTVTASRLLVVDPREFRALVRTVPAFADLVARDLARRISS